MYYGKSQGRKSDQKDKGGPGLRCIQYPDMQPDYADYGVSALFYRYCIAIVAGSSGVWQCLSMAQGIYPGSLSECISQQRDLGWIPEYDSLHSGQHTVLLRPYHSSRLCFDKKISSLSRRYFLVFLYHHHLLLIQIPYAAHPANHQYSILQI